MSSINKVMIQGTVVSVRKHGRGSSIQVATDGGSKRGRNRNQSDRSDSDFPVIEFPRSVNVSNINVRDMVLISAKAGTRFERTDDRVRFSVIIEGVSIKKADRLLAKYNLDLIGTEGGRPDDMNFVLIRGEVSNVYVPETKSGIVILSIKTDEDGSVHHSRISCYQRQASKAKTAKPGDTVMVAGSVRTFEETRSGGNADMWILCKDIEILKRKDEEEKHEQNNDA